MDASLSGFRRWVLATVAATVAVGAMFGGYGLLTDAEGLGAKSEWLDGSPFPDYRIPGIILLAVIGGGMMLTALFALCRSRFTGVAALAMGVVLLIWGLVETVTIGYQGTAQILLVTVWVVGPAVPLLKLGWDATRPIFGRRAVTR